MKFDIFMEPHVSLTADSNSCRTLNSLLSMGDRIYTRTGIKEISILLDV